MNPTLAVLVRRIPHPDRLSVNRRTGRLIVEDIPFILNPVDLEALEHAFRLREQHQARIVVLSVDHTGAQAELREALAMGADEAILLSDPAFEDTDPGSQAHIFKLALEKFVRPQVVFAAARSMDHTWSTIGPHLAYLLNWPLVVEAEEVALDGENIRAVAHTGAHRARVESPTPCIVSVARDGVTPRIPTAWGVADAYDEHRLLIKSLADLGPPADVLAVLSAKTQVRRVTETPRTRQRRIIDGSTEEVARILARRLIDQGWGGRRP